MRKRKVWFITGASRGLGRTWAEAALARGDQVVAAVRDVAKLSDLASEYGDNLLAVSLDTSVRTQAFRAVERAVAHFGEIDVLINNAGYCLAGALEELDEDEARESLDTNVLGVLWVTQATLPVMRKQQSGHIVSISSVSGLVGQPTIGIYNTAKWAIEGMMEALSHEVAGFGIKVSIVEPAVFKTGFASPDSMRFSATIDAYDEVRTRLYEALASEPINDPLTAVQPLLSLVDSSEPPLRLLLGTTALRWAVISHSNRLSSWVR